MNAIKKAVAIGAVVAYSATAVASPLTRPSLDDRIAIDDVIASIGLYADQQEWDRLEASFTPEVTTDYVSLFGGAPQTRDRTALVASWRGLRPTTPEELTTAPSPTPSESEDDPCSKPILQTGYPGRSCRQRDPARRSEHERRACP